MAPLKIYGAVTMTPLEILGTVTGFLCVALTVRRNIWCWPIGIVSVIAYALLFVQIKLYADAGLQGFFFVTSIQAWYWWAKGQVDDSLPVTWLTATQRWICAAVTLAAVALCGWLFAHYTDAHLPYWDAIASGGSVTAQILLMRKKIENWHLWLFVDVLYVGIYIYKQVYLTAGLYAVFLMLAWLGLREWRAAARPRLEPDVA